MELQRFNTDTLHPTDYSNNSIIDERYLQTPNEAEKDKLKLLSQALQEYKHKWDKELIENSVYTENQNLRIQRNSMIYMAQWIINSIDGGLNKIHSTNICNIVLEQQTNE